MSKSSTTTNSPSKSRSGESAGAVSRAPGRSGLIAREHQSTEKPRPRAERASARLAVAAAFQTGSVAVATPDRITTHPGEVLAEEFLKPLGLSVNALAMALRVPATRMGAIVKAERAVTADTALRLARFFGTSPEFWVNLQSMHDLTKARSQTGKAIARDVQPHAA